MEAIEQLAICPLVHKQYNEVIDYTVAKSRGLITSKQRRDITIKSMGSKFIDFNEYFAVKQVGKKIIKICFK